MKFCYYSQIWSKQDSNRGEIVNLIIHPESVSNSSSVEFFDENKKFICKMDEKELIQLDEDMNTHVHLKKDFEEIDQTLEKDSNGDLMKKEPVELYI